MAFIDRKDPLVLNIKLTSKGRELLSRGRFNFKYFAIGDSEIDYNYIKKAKESNEEFNPIKSKILRPVDKNPKIISFVTKNLVSVDELFDEKQYNKISNIPSITWQVKNNVDGIGFFTLSNDENFVFKTTPEYIKQPDMMVDMNSHGGELDGGNELKLKKTDNYGSSTNEPEVGDYLLIRWVGIDGTFKTNEDYEIKKNKPAPILIYKIIEIISGSLNNNNLVVIVDRELPKLNSNDIGVMALYSNAEFGIEEEFNTDYVNDPLITFLENCQCDTIRFPYWKLSIIYTENIAGTQTHNKQFGEFDTNLYGGFVSYIQNQAIKYKKLGVIHYTNTSPANMYGEGFDLQTPSLILPTIMWHKSKTTEVGLILSPTDEKKKIEGTYSSLDTTYYDLVDGNDNIVGKVFNDLKIFVIEDQELLFAMSYKSNRSWTLPNFKVGV